MKSKRTSPESTWLTVGPSDSALSESSALSDQEREEARMERGRNGSIELRSERFSIVAILVREREMEKERKEREKGQERDHCFILSV